MSQKSYTPPQTKSVASERKVPQESTAVPTSAPASAPLAKGNVVVGAFRFAAPFLILAAGWFGYQTFGQRGSTKSEQEKAITEIRGKLTTKEKEIQDLQQKLARAEETLNPVESESTVPTGTAVHTAPIENFDEPFVIEIDGESVTYRIITVPAEVEGRVVRKTDKCRGGSYIQSGTVLFELDPTDYQLEIDRLNALRRQSQEELKTNDVDIANNRSLLKIAEEDLGLQNRRFERIESLRKKKAATESDIDTAQMQQLTSRNSFQTISNLLRSNEQRKETIKAGLALIDAQLKKAHSDLKRTKVIARTSATVVDDLVEEGDYVKSGDPLVHLSDSSRMEIKCSLQSDELGWIWRQARMKHAAGDITPEQRYGLPLTPCEVVYEFEGFEVIWEGVLSRFEGVGLDKDTRMVPCRVLVQEPTNTRVVNPDGKAPDVVPPSLLSGMYVTVRIPIRSPIPLVKVPVEAVRPGGQLWIMRGGKLQIAKTQPVHTEREYALLRQDSLQLEAGDRVVISPLPSVSDGMPIREASRL